MNFSNFLDKECSIYRALDPNINGQVLYSATPSEETKCHIQQASDEEAAYSEGVFGKVFKIYFPAGTNIKESDKITIDSVEYFTSGVKNYEYGGKTPHMKIVANLPKND